MSHPPLPDDSNDSNDNDAAPESAPVSGSTEHGAAEPDSTEPGDAPVPTADPSGPPAADVPRAGGEFTAADVPAAGEVPPSEEVPPLGAAGADGTNGAGVAAASRPRRLTRSRTDRMLGGVCGGIAEYFGLDATWVRVAFVVSIILPGPQFLLYLLLWIVIPRN